MSRQLSRRIRRHRVRFTIFTLRIREKPPEIVEVKPVQNDASLEELFDEEVKNILGEISDTEEPMADKPIEKREDYLFNTPPDGQSIVCKLMDVRCFNE